MIWNRAGQLSILPVAGEYRQAVALGFVGATDVAVGFVIRSDYSVEPGAWGPGGFVSYAHSGFGGRIASGNETFLVGDTYQSAGGQFVATLWDAAGKPTIVEGLAGVNSSVRGINADGMYVGITGNSANPANYARGFIGRGKDAVRLNFPGFPQARGLDINDSGWFTGYWQMPDQRLRGYVARVDLDTGAQEIHDLGLFPGTEQTLAQAINNDGTIVGGAVGGPFGDVVRALIWPNGSLVPQDLNLFVDLPGVTLIDAYRINNAGQILAEGLSDSGNYAYYVLTPVPEPGAIAGGGVVTLALRRRGLVRPAR